MVRLEPAAEVSQHRRGLGLPHESALVGRLVANRLLDTVELADEAQRLACQPRRLVRLVDLVETPSRVHPASRVRYASAAEQLRVPGVVVGLQEPAPVAQQPLRVFARAAVRELVIRRRCHGLPGAGVGAALAARR